MTRWLVTGGCGFIGTALIQRLVSQPGVSIRVLDNGSVGTAEDLARVAEVSGTDRPGAVRLISGDVRDAACCLEAAREVDVIVHLAANTGVAPSVEDPRFDCETNVTGTVNVLEAARPARARFVFASSGAPVGECTPPIHEEVVPHPVSPYGASKLAGEAYCSAYFRTFRVPTTALRFGNVYGPGSTRKSSVVARFIRRALAGKPCEIYGDGTQTRDFIYIDDLTSAILKAARAGADVAGEVFQIATGREHTVNEVARALRAILEEHGVPMTLTSADPRPGDVTRSYADTTKARTRLGWEARTGLDQGLRRTVQWFLSPPPSGA